MEFTQEQLLKLGYYNNKNTKIEFNEDTIRTLFWHEAAEDETIDRFKMLLLS